MARPRKNGFEEIAISERESDQENGRPLSEHIDEVIEVARFEANRSAMVVASLEEIKMKLNGEIKI